MAVVSTSWAEPGRGLFSISVAAELTGLHPQTLRLYEHEGLLSPNAGDLRAACVCQGPVTACRGDSCWVCA